MTIRMTHPESGGEYDAQPSQVPHLQESGWRVEPGQTEQGETWPAEAQRFEGQQRFRLRHPDLDTEIVVAESAVPYHRERGWLVVEEPAEEGGAIQETDRRDMLTVEQLRDEARTAGMAVSGTKAELLERLRSAPAEAGQTTEESEA